MEKIYQRRDDIILRSISGEYMLVPINSTIFSENKLMMLSETGMFLWQKLQKPQTIDDLLYEAISEFKGDSDQIKLEICEFIDCLMENNLVFCL